MLVDVLAGGVDGAHEGGAGLFGQVSVPVSVPLREQDVRVFVETARDAASLPMSD